MTMNTRVHIAKAVNPEGLFLHVLGVLAADPLFVPAWDPLDDADPFRPQPGPLRHGGATYWHVRKGDQVMGNDGTVVCHATTGVPFIETENQFRTTIGQGLAANWEVTYATDAPLKWPDYDDEREDYGNTVEPMPVHLVSANFDTEYGYHLPTGAHCGDLHAFILSLVAIHLDDQGVDEWCWMHEENRTWHGPAEIARRGDPALAAAHFLPRGRHTKGAGRGQGGPIDQ
jgi:hypothetical protein